MQIGILTANPNNGIKAITTRRGENMRKREHYFL